MKWCRFTRSPGDTEFVPGDWNTIDDITGFKVKASTTTKEWDGFRSQKSLPRHEQDFIRSTNETIRAPWSRPEPSADFTNAGAEVENGNFLSSTGWTLGASWAITTRTLLTGYASYTAGSTDTMYQDVNGVTGKVYLVAFTVSNYVGAGSVTASMGTGSGTARTADGTYIEEITSSGTNPQRLTFTPAAGGTSFDIDNVSVLRVG